MAPNNKPKKPTMLQRQRQLRAQQQQVRRASSNQLPPSGSSSGNSRQARAQRANTTRAQAANNQRVINRGIEGFIRRGNAQDKLDKAAQGTRGSGTRTAGAGGGLARRPSSAVTTTNRGTAKPPKPAALPPGQRGGALATRPSASPAKPQPKPPAQRGGAIEKAGPTIDVKANTPKVGGGSPAKPPVRTGQPGPNRAALPPGRPSGAPANGNGGAARAGVRAAGSALGRAGGAVVGLGTAAAVIDQARRVFNPKDNLLTSLQQLGRSVSKATGDTSASGGRPGYRQRGGAATSNNKPAKPVADYRDAQGNLYDGNTGRLKQAAPRRSTAPTRSSGGNPPAPGSSRRQPSSGGGSSAPSRPSRPQTSSGTAGKGQQWSDFNPNRGTSQTNNPLIKNDSWMMQRMKDREAAQQSGDAQKVGNKFDTKSDVYTPNTKVDGSGLDTKKIDQKKVDEYKRRKKRYYD